MSYKDDIFVLTNGNGEQVTCWVLLTFDIEETGRHYMVYTDKSRNENGSYNLYAAICEPGSTCLELVKTEQEWEVINDVIRDLDEKIMNSFPMRLKRWITGWIDRLKAALAS